MYVYLVRCDNGDTVAFSNKNIASKFVEERGGELQRIEVWKRY